MPVISGFIAPHPPLIVPEVGKGQEKKIRKTVDNYHAIAKKIAQMKPETIIVISPHSISYADYIHVSPGDGAAGGLEQFGARMSIYADYDSELVAEIAHLCAERDFPAGTLGEKDKSLDHGTVVPLYFVNRYHSDYKLVRCSISGLSRREHYTFGMILRKALDNLERNCVIIASGDLSHKLNDDGPYGFTPEGPRLDEELTGIMKTANFIDFMRLDMSLCEKGAECGLSSFIIMSGILDRLSVKSDFMSYEGPFGVGYALCAFDVLGNDGNRDFLNQYNEELKRGIDEIRRKESCYVRFARMVLENYINTGAIPQFPADLPEEIISNRAGIFVSIKKDGQLRGCIGTITPVQDNIALEIVANAISAGTKDNRFSPVLKDELEWLTYSVDVLSESEPIDNKSLLDVKRYGVIVTCGNKRGLLLPDIDGIDTVDEQIRVACRKGGISSGENYRLERFEVVRYK